MEFRTVVNPSKSHFEIGHTTKILVMGSCFAENIGKRLTEFKFNINLNPFGVVFNPISIAQNIERLLINRPYSSEELFIANDCWNSFDHHSRFSNFDKAQCLININEAYTKSVSFLKNCDVVILTLGTAWYYNYTKTGKVVSNCHKLPGTEFERQITDIEEVTDRFTQLILRLRQVNTNIKVILTVSPVRHLKDGAEGNQISKAILRLACQQLIVIENVMYFPAYEILLDDLRDYRFYDSDLVHPSSTAIDYIFEKFSYCFFSENTKKLNRAISEIVNASQHRPNVVSSPIVKDFAIKMLAKIDKISSWVDVNFDSEVSHFKQFV